MALDEARLARLLRRQDGVVSRRQLIDLGASPNDVRRLQRRRDLTAVHEGVYVDHTGRPTARQREWAAVLRFWPSALHRETALAAAGLNRDRADGGERVIHLVVDADRNPEPAPGIRIERVRRAARWIEADRRPPRVMIEFAALKVAATRSEARAVAVLADVCRQGLSTPVRLLATLAELARLPGRATLSRLLADVAEGAHSVLEQRYLERVERAHGLPRGERQLRETTCAGVVFRDVTYPAHRTLVELDGRFGHTDTDDRWDDLDRDVAATVSGQLTLRLGWRQVLDPCRAAMALGRILGARGWQGSLTTCGPDCPVDRVAPVSPGDTDPPRSARSA